MLISHTKEGVLNIEDTSRRRLLNWLLGGSLLGFIIATVYPLVRFLFPTDIEPASSKDWAEGANANEIKVGDGKLIKVANKPVWLIQPYENDYRALSAVCTHLGCIIKWNPDSPDGHKQHFYCYCHAGIFDANGNVLGGPPPRPLPFYEVKIASGKILVKG